MHRSLGSLSKHEKDLVFIFKGIGFVQEIWRTSNVQTIRLMFCRKMFLISVLSTSEAFTTKKSWYVSCKISKSISSLRLWIPWATALSVIYLMAQPIPSERPFPRPALT